MNLYKYRLKCKTILNQKYAITKDAQKKMCILHTHKHVYTSTVMLQC